MPRRPITSRRNPNGTVRMPSMWRNSTAYATATWLAPWHNGGMGLMREIRDYPVPRNSVAIWWLGQNGFIFKSPEGVLLSTDLYLTNSCASIYADSGVNLDRKVPVL